MSNAEAIGIILNSTEAILEPSSFPIHAVRPRRIRAGGGVGLVADFGRASRQYLDKVVLPGRRGILAVAALRIRVGERVFWLGFAASGSVYLLVSGLLRTLPISAGQTYGLVLEATWAIALGIFGGLLTKAICKSIRVICPAGVAGVRANKETNWAIPAIRGHGRSIRSIYANHPDTLVPVPEVPGTAVPLAPYPKDLEAAGNRSTSMQGRMGASGS